MKKLLTAILCAALMGCATAGFDETAAREESETAAVYTRLFEKEAAERGLALNLSRLRVYEVDGFGSELNEAGVIGLCVSRGIKKLVYLDKNTLNSYDSMQREMLVFHEFGHCVLGLGHDKSADDTGVPLSLMYPINFDSTYYASNRKYYLDNLFGKVIKILEEGEQRGEQRNHACRWGKYKRANRAKGSTDRSVHNGR